MLRAVFCVYVTNGLKCERTGTHISGTISDRSRVASMDWDYFVELYNTLRMLIYSGCHRHQDRRVVESKQSVSTLLSCPLQLFLSSTMHAMPWSQRTIK